MTATIPLGSIIIEPYSPVGQARILSSIPCGNLEIDAYNPSCIWNLVPGQIFGLQTIYECVLTGDADGLSDLVLPMASFQSTMRNGEASYLACMIPDATAYKAGILARTNGDIVVKKGYRFSDGTTQMEELCRVDYESLRIDRDPTMDVATISGHRTATATASKSVTLTGVSYQGYRTDGKNVFRAEPDLFLRVGDTAVHGSYSFVVGEISYAVGTNQATMQVTEE